MSGPLTPPHLQTRAYAIGDMITASDTSNWICIWLGSSSGSARQSASGPAHQSASGSSIWVIYVCNLLSNRQSALGNLLLVVLLLAGSINVLLLLLILKVGASFITCFLSKNVVVLQALASFALKLTLGYSLRSFAQSDFGILLRKICLRNLSCSWNFTPGLWYLLLVLKSYPKFNPKSHTSGWISFWQSVSLQPKFGIYFSSVSDSSPISKCNPNSCA
jgi:hypothetical protein